jgi:SAM-dependent methyltransferase
MSESSGSATRQRSLKELTVRNKGVTDSAVITGRSLFLNRYLCVSDPIQDGMVGGDFILKWSSDTVIGMLALTPALLKQWSGGRILDVGSGIGFFGTEARELGIHVDRLDLNATRATAEDVDALEIYFENMRRVGETLIPGPAGSFAKEYKILTEHSSAIANNYLNDIEGTIQGNAQNMETIPSNRYDVAVSIWLLAYLRVSQQKDVVREMIRVTKRGGQVRIHSGDKVAAFNDAMFKSVFKSDLRYELRAPPSGAGEYRIHEKVVTINRGQSSGNLLVLDVAFYDPSVQSTVIAAINPFSAVGGERCVVCKAIHGRVRSALHHWHRCTSTSCNRLYCPACGRNLPGKRSWDRGRDCSECRARTRLV